MTEFIYTRPPLYPKQTDFVDCPARYTLVEACTKIGKTVACLIWINEKTMFLGMPGRNFWWVAPTRPVAKIAYARNQQWIAQSGLPIRAFEFRDLEQSIKFPNGAKLWFKGAEKPDNLYGEDVYAAVVDEATRCREESWHALRSTLTFTKGPVKIIGNVRGKKNWAYKMARRAEMGEKNMAYFKLTAWDAVDADVLDRAEILDAQAVLPPHVFDELYLAIASDDGGNPFGLAAIEDCLLVGLAPGPAVVYGIDLAKKKDWLALIGLNAERQVCKLMRWHDSWENSKRRIFEEVGHVPTLVDETGVGNPIVEELHEKRSNIEGYLFTLQSKQHLMESLESAIHQRLIGFPDGTVEAQPPDWLKQELDNFEFEFTRIGVRYSAPEGLHDDGVCALALANWHFEKRPAPPEILNKTRTINEATELTERVGTVRQGAFNRYFG